MNNKPQPYSYVFLAVIVIAALILLPVLWRILKGVIRIIVTVAVLGFAIYGIYVFMSVRTQNRG